MAHTVSTTQPPSGALGDEWFNPTTNKLYKLVALGGTSVSWQDGGNIISGTSGATATATAASVVAALSAGSGIIIAANGQISSSASGGFSSNVDNVFNAKQTFQGNATATALKLINAAEQVYLSGISLGSTGNTTVNIDFANSSVYYFNTNASGNWNINFRLSPTTGLNTALGNSESISMVIMATQGLTPYYANSILIDGVTVTPKWQDALSPTGGNPSSVDIYNYTILKTDNATYTVLGSQTRFA
jgi:hypothetical protein